MKKLLAVAALALAASGCVMCGPSNARSAFTLDVSSPGPSSTTASSRSRRARRHRMASSATLRAMHHSRRRWRTAESPRFTMSITRSRTSLALSAPRPPSCGANDHAYWRDSASVLTFAGQDGCLKTPHVEGQRRVAISLQRPPPLFKVTVEMP